MAVSAIGVVVGSASVASCSLSYPTFLTTDSGNANMQAN